MPWLAEAQSERLAAARWARCSEGAPSARPRRRKSVQRKCAGCAGEEYVQRKSADVAANAVAQGGAPLTPEQRAYFEPRFGRDLSGVRVHTDTAAADAARAIHARAYTLGSDIAFDAGEYDGASASGKRLLAHELAHVAQQSAAPAASIQRTVAATSNCAAGSSPNAPAVPLDDLQAADAEAQRMALGASNVLDLEALTFRDPTFGPSYVSTAYRSRFGPPPPAPGNRFRNRFTGAILATRAEAAAAEMRFLSTRFKRLHEFLAGNIRYRCVGTTQITVGGCTSRCVAGDFARSCVPNDARTIHICDGFWGLSAPQRAAVIVHELVHMRLNFAAENSATANQRGRNPECYASLILDLYREGVAAAILTQFNTADPSCPPI